MGGRIGIVALLIVSLILSGCMTPDADPGPSEAGTGDDEAWDEWEENDTTPSSSPLVSTPAPIPTTTPAPVPTTTPTRVPTATPTPVPTPTTTPVPTATPSEDVPDSSNVQSDDEKQIEDVISGYYHAWDERNAGVISSSIAKNPDGSLNEKADQAKIIEALALIPEHKTHYINFTSIVLQGNNATADCLRKISIRLILFNVSMTKEGPIRIFLIKEEELWKIRNQKIMCDAGENCCEISFDCEKYETCDTVNRQCIPKNLPNGERCSDDRACVSNHCLNDVCCESNKTCCGYDFECEKQKCDLELHYCVPLNLDDGERCSEDADCASSHCLNNACCEQGRTCCLKDYNCGKEKCDNSKHYCVPKTDVPDGDSCSENSECTSGNCQNDICCEDSKTCCKYDMNCGHQKCDTEAHYCVPKNSENGESCFENSECASGNCQNMVCCEAGKKCCGSDLFCGNQRCDTALHYCVPKTDVPDGDSCSESSECTSGNCQNNVCCESGKTCCKSDLYCGNKVCNPSFHYCVLKSDVPNGDSCSESSECTSGNCQNNMCCESGKTCCKYDFNCGREKCDTTNHYCIPKNAENGESCLENSECASGNCQNLVCCEAGKTCCGDDVFCGYQRCDTSLHYCIPKTDAANGESCSENGVCTSGNCQNNICCDSGKTCCQYDFSCDYGTEKCDTSTHYCVSK